MSQNKTTEEWTYYSPMIPGYVEKNTMRGMRDRNRTLLAQLCKVKDETKTEPLKRKLVENNLPLARYTAERFCLKFGWRFGNVDDAYQECCLKLIEFMDSLDDELIRKPNFFQVRMFRSMYSRLYSEQNLKACPENTHEYIKFDEDLFLSPGEKKIDKDMIRELIDLVPESPRDIEVFKDFWFGNKELYIEPGNTEDVGMAHYLTRGRVLQIVNKTIRLLRRYNKIPIESFFTS